MQTGRAVLDVAVRLIAHAADETAALRLDIQRIGHYQFYATHEGVDVYLLILCDDSLAQVQAESPAESVKSGSVERLTFIYIFIATVVNRTADALALFRRWNRSLQPLAWVATITVDYKMYPDI